MRHPSQTDILSFAAGQAPEARAEKLYAHIAGCEACAGRYQAVQALRSDFEGSWEAFLAEATARAAMEVRGVAPSPVDTLRVVLQGLIDGSSRLASAALRRAAGAVSTAEPLRAAFVPVYSGVADPAAGTEAGVLAEEASDLLSRGEGEKAREALVRARASAPDVAASAALDLWAGERLAGRVFVDASRGTVSVLVYPEVLGVASGSVTLESEGPSGPRRLESPLTTVEGAPYLLAELEDVPDGGFRLTLEVTPPGK